MAIPSTVKNYLEKNQLDYDLVAHRHTTSSLETAATSHIAADSIAKGVILKDANGFVLAVLPAANHLDLKLIEDRLLRRLELATENEFRGMFPDCQLGAIPALGSAYNIDTIVDDELLTQSEIFFEAGNHEQLVHISEPQFERLMSGSNYSHFSNALV